MDIMGPAAQKLRKPSKCLQGRKRGLHGHDPTAVPVQACDKAGLDWGGRLPISSPSFGAR